MGMKLPEGIVVDAEKTFGNLKYSAMRAVRYETDEEGKSTGVIRSRTFDLKSEAQGMMIQVILPPEAGEKEYAYNTPVKLTDPFIDTIASATFGGRADAGWYIKAADIVPLTDKDKTVPSKAEGAAAGASGPAGVAGVKPEAAGQGKKG